MKFAWEATRPRKFVPFGHTLACGELMRLAVRSRSAQMPTLRERANALLWAKTTAFRLSRRTPTCPHHWISRAPLEHGLLVGVRRRFCLRTGSRKGILRIVTGVAWREKVAALLVEAGQTLSAGNSRQAGVVLGTVLAYLEKGRASGDDAAAELLLQLVPRVKEDPTERFSFAPGELEKISGASKSSPR